MIRQKLLIVINSHWTSTPGKIDGLKKVFAPKIQLDIDTKETSYLSIPFTDYGTQKRIDDIWFDETITPLGQGYDVIAFVVPDWQWKTDFWGVKRITSNQPSRIEIRCDETEPPYQTAVIGESTPAFLELMCHELAHHFYSLTPSVPDRTHEFVEKYKPAGWLPYFFTDWIAPIPNEADSPSKLRDWIYAIIAFLKSFTPLTPADEQILTEIAENEGRPPVPLPPKVSRLREFALAIQEFEGWYPGSRSYRNKNPGNLKYSGQSGAIGKDSGGHAIFATYEAGFNALIYQLKIVCNGTSNAFNNAARTKYGLSSCANLTLYQFCTIYAEANAKPYSEFLAKKLNAPAQTLVKTFL